MYDRRVLKNLIDESQSIVFFGGAGVSTESGIPDFRGNNGIYTTADADGISPEEILHCNYLYSHPKEFFDYYKNNMIFSNAKPNPAHYALAEFEKKGKLSAVITQNIDGLHQKAGSKNVIELHGSTLKNHCVRCGKHFGIEHIINSRGIPLCDECGGLVRPDVVLYGEPLDNEAFEKAENLISSADLLVIGGTSLTVYPAAGLCVNYYGENIVIINKTKTVLDNYAKMVIREPIGEVFKSLGFGNC